MSQKLSGITVLVTRPQPAANRFARLIQQHGGTPICQPGVVLVPAEDTEQSLSRLDQMTADDIVIFTSANAVRFALQRKPATRWPATAMLVAVGRRSADALIEAGLDQVLVPEKGADSESVLRLTPLQQVSGRRILIACAPGGRDLLQTQLEARGARVCPVYLYRRESPVVDQALQREIRLAMDQLVITASSVTILDNITRLLGREFADRPLCVISQRIAEQARQLGYTRIRVADSPDDQAMLTAVFAAVCA